MLPTALPFALLATLPAAAPQDDVADVPSRDLRAGDVERMRYFLIGAEEQAEAPEDGFRLLVVLPGGDGSADFNAFVRRIWKHALNEQYLVAQLVAPQWSADQAEKLVWPTERNPWPDAEFTTEAFVAAVIEDVEKRHAVDPAYVFTLSWSSGGPAAYAVSLMDDTLVTGSFVAMSVFKPDQLPSLKAAKGQAYYLLHSPEDFIPIAMAEEAEKQLGKKGAEVELARYSGGHGWRGDVYGMMRKGVEWLERHHAKPPKRRAKRGK